jgi:hypothetical protein
MPLGSTHLLTEMSTRNLTGFIGQPAYKADNLTANVVALMPSLSVAGIPLAYNSDCYNIFVTD